MVGASILEQPRKNCTAPKVRRPISFKLCFSKMEIRFEDKFSLLLQAIRSKYSTFNPEHLLRSEFRLISPSALATM